MKMLYLGWANLKPDRRRCQVALPHCSCVFILQIPIFIYTPEEEGQFQPGRCSRWWLAASLESLDAELRSLGSRLLCFRATESHTALLSLVQELGAEGVFFNHLYDPISMVRDAEVKGALNAQGFMCCSFNGDLLREPWEVMDKDSKPFVTFAEFWEAHELGPPLPMPLPGPVAMPPVSDALEGISLSELGIMTAEENLSNEQLSYHWKPGCAGARKLLNSFINNRLHKFDKDKAKTDRKSTSRLSPHIHFGEISVREVHASVLRKAAELGLEKSAVAVSDFLRQLGYREYSRYLSFHFPFTHERSLLEHLRAVPWRLDQALFKAWRTGTTGYPLVDAAMRELWSTGWMHNRMRVVCASFLVKDLLLPWQWGLKHYWDALLDADLECDALGWQYCAGCLVDAHPFSYCMDLERETKRFDPDGNFVRRWMPVLSRLPKEYIHEPWKAPPKVLADAGVELGVNYPWPVIEVQESRTMLAAAAAVIDADVDAKCGTDDILNNSTAFKDAVNRAAAHAGCKRTAYMSDVLRSMGRNNNSSDQGECGDSVPKMATNVDPAVTIAPNASVAQTLEMSRCHRESTRSETQVHGTSPFRPPTSTNPSAAFMMWGSKELIKRNRRRETESEFDVERMKHAVYFDSGSRLAEASVEHHQGRVWSDAIDGERAVPMRHAKASMSEEVQSNVMLIGDESEHTRSNVQERSERLGEADSRDGRAVTCGESEASTSYKQKNEVFQEGTCRIDGTRIVLTDKSISDRWHRGHFALEEMKGKREDVLHEPLQKVSIERREGIGRRRKNYHVQRRATVSVESVDAWNMRKVEAWLNECHDFQQKPRIGIRKGDSSGESRDAAVTLPPPPLDDMNAGEEELRESCNVDLRRIVSAKHAVHCCDDADDERKKSSYRTAPSGDGTGSGGHYNSNSGNATATFATSPGIYGSGQKHST